MKFFTCGYNIDENGNEIEVNIVNVLEIDGKSYALLSVDANEEDANLFVNRVRFDANGDISLSLIEDENEKKYVFDVINELISGME